MIKLLLAGYEVTLEPPFPGLGAALRAPRLGRGQNPAPEHLWAHDDIRELRERAAIDVAVGLQRLADAQTKLRAAAALEECE